MLVSRKVIWDTGAREAILLCPEHQLPALDAPAVSNLPISIAEQVLTVQAVYLRYTPYNHLRKVHILELFKSVVRKRLAAH